MRGKVGVGHLTKEDGEEAARLTALSCLATIRNHLGGSLNRVRRVVKSLVMVNGTEDFEHHIFVANGFARVFKQVFGAECGVGARSAIGMGSLPMNQTVEVEMIVEIDNGGKNSISSWTTSIPELDPVIKAGYKFNKDVGIDFDIKDKASVNAVISKLYNNKRADHTKIADEHSASIVTAFP